MSAPHRLIRTAVAGALAVAFLVSCTGDDDAPSEGDSTAERAAAAVTELAEAWAELDPDRFGTATDDPSAAAAGLTALVSELSVTAAAVATDGTPVCSGSSCRQTVQVALDLAGIGTWDYGTVVTVEVADGDDVAPVATWQPSVLHPQLTAGTTLERTRRVPVRASILDRDGYLLTSPKPAFRIGVEPGKARPSTYPRLEALLGIDGDALRRRAAAAEPEWFVDVITYRLDDYRPVREQLFRIPGVVVDYERLSLGPSSTWGRAVLGSVAPATEETLAGASPLALATDVVGSSGLQAAYEQRLAGTPGGAVTIVDAATGERQGVLWRQPPERGEALRTTLSFDVQQAGEQAVAGQDKTTALVAVDARTGEVLADVNGPEITSYDTGLVGEYPPGSTFKVVSTAALLQSGQELDQAAACPSTTVVDGKRFKNYEFTSLPAGATFADAIAASCNTTVVERADRLDDDSLRDAAEQFGVGAEWDLPLPAYSGSVPVATSLVDRAASMIGQGRVLMSPLGMAMVAAHGVVGPGQDAGAGGR